MAVSRLFLIAIALCMMQSVLGEEIKVKAIAYLGETANDHMERETEKLQNVIRLVQTEINEVVQNLADIDSEVHAAAEPIKEEAVPLASRIIESATKKVKKIIQKCNDKMKDLIGEENLAKLKTCVGENGGEIPSEAYTEMFNCGMEKVEEGRKLLTKLWELTEEARQFLQAIPEKARNCTAEGEVKKQGVIEGIKKIFNKSKAVYCLTTLGAKVGAKAATKGYELVVKGSESYNFVTQLETVIKTCLHEKLGKFAENCQVGETPK